MDWKDIKGYVAEAAPMIGTLLGGGPGGAVGSMISQALGVENTPDAVSKALQNDPEALQKIKQLELDHERELRRLMLTHEQKVLEEETARITQTHETMRAELKHEGVFKSGWRPAIGWVMAFVFGGLIASLVYAIIQEPSTAPQVVDSATVIITVMLGVLGISVRERSRDKRTQQGLIQPGILESISERIRKGPK